MPRSELDFDSALAGCTRFAYHLEMRDTYAVSYEKDDFEAWRVTGRWDNPAYWQPWIEQARSAAARGVVLKRLRIVSLPPTEYIRFEYAGTVNNITAGEDVRWLPRRNAADLALPGADFWVFDGTVVRWGHFDGDGEYLGDEFSTDTRIAAFCTQSFEQAWPRAIPHAEFRL